LLALSKLYPVPLLQNIAIPSDSKFRALVHRLVYNKYMDNFMMFVILSNMIVMFTVSMSRARDSCVVLRVWV